MLWICSQQCEAPLLQLSTVQAMKPKGWKSKPTWIKFWTRGAAAARHQPQQPKVEIGSRAEKRPIVAEKLCYVIQRRERLILKFSKMESSEGRASALQQRLQARREMFLKAENSPQTTPSAQVLVFLTIL